MKLIQTQLITTPTVIHFILKSKKKRLSLWKNVRMKLKQGFTQLHWMKEKLQQTSVTAKM